MYKLEIPDLVRDALTRQRDHELRERAEKRRKELDADRVWAAEREKLRPRARVVLDFAAAVAASGLVPERGVKIRGKPNGRERIELVVDPCGGVALLRIYPPHGGERREILGEDDLLRWPTDVAIVQDLAAAIESGQIWQRVLAGLA